MEDRVVIEVQETLDKMFIAGFILSCVTIAYGVALLIVAGIAVAGIAGGAPGLILLLLPAMYPVYPLGLRWLRLVKRLLVFAF